MGPLAQLTEIARRAHDFVGPAVRVPGGRRSARSCASHGIRVCDPDELTGPQDAFLDDYFDAQVYPVLTPLAIDPAHPFPHLHNKSLNLILRIETIGQDPPRQLYAVLQVPSVLNRLVPLPDEGDGQRRFVLLEDVIGPRLDALFGGFRVAALRLVPRHPQQRPDDPGDRGQESACCRRSRRPSASGSGAPPSGWRSPTAPTRASSPSSRRPRRSTSTTATSTRCPARST